MTKRSNIAISRAAAALSLSVASGACVVATPVETATPVEPAARSFTVPLLDTGRWGTVMMGADGAGEPQRMVFDTAAGGHVLDRAAAGRLNLLKDATAAGGTVVGAGGVAEGGQRVIARNVAFSDLVLGDTEFLVYDLSSFSKRGARIDGIIGNALFGRYSTLFDMPNNRVILTEASQVERGSDFACQDNAAGTQRPSELQHFPIVEVEIGSGSGASGGVAATAVIDTGSAGTTLNWPAAHAIGIKEGDPALRAKGASSTGLDGKKMATSYNYTLPFFRVGNRILRNHEVTISPMPVFEAVRLKDQPAMILGLSVLRTQALAIDKDANRICFGAGVA